MDDVAGFSRVRKLKALLLSLSVFAAKEPVHCKEFKTNTMKAEKRDLLS